ncbi:uncharacterized protein YjgD (DUF1641 family) [Peribacillus deserti]|uniref:Uncharacterized protein YjgD (DUF1641 family) n=1 Tax=Peribacillus deserti TaxID=673318 RepID=A0ABS2QL76_9BACI|nr:DUF1641 domain-containing protein [Peribacillus deserti]MBM7693924.1 uncharacterized protein YjgD (DUF1641 family) [Peribacillus deserti]
MAKAIKSIQRVEITEEQQKQLDLEEVQNALVESKESILEVLKTLNHMQERGVLSLISALFGQGDKVMEILVKKADTPETANTLKNLLLMVGVLGTLNVQQLEPILLKVNSGIARVADHKDTEEKTGILDIMRSLRDPEINRSITLLLNFLKGMGQETESLERTTQLPENQLQHQTPNHQLK